MEEEIGLCFTNQVLNPSISSLKREIPDCGRVCEREKVNLTWKRSASKTHGVSLVLLFVVTSQVLC
jgi:hypothetical protein